MNIFYQPDESKNFLEGEEAQHCLKVLRMRSGDMILITDGRGKKIKAQLTSTTRRECLFEQISLEYVEPRGFMLEMAVCPTRKADRNEWMVEKMSEIGVDRISFLVSTHTHQETLNRVVNLDRIRRIALSAMKQSQQFYLPEIRLFQSFEDFFEQNASKERYIAYVSEEGENRHLVQKVKCTESVAVLIGPEGDFSPAEIGRSIEIGFEPVSLGNTRLRTETAAVVACQSVHMSKILQV